MQCVLLLERDAGAVAASVQLPFRLTGSPSRCLSDVVALVHRVVMEGAGRGAWGPLQLPWPLPAGERAEAVFHVSPTLVPGWPDQRQYGVALALALISALTGRRCVPGLVALGELSLDGRTLPMNSLDETELGWVEDVVEAGAPGTLLLLPTTGALRLKHLLARKGAPRVQRNLEVVGMDRLGDAVLCAFDGALG